MLEVEINTCPVLCLSERNLYSLLSGQFHHRVTKLIGKALHHTSIDRAFDECGHSLRHSQRQLVRTAKVIVGDVGHDRLTQFCDVVGKLLGVHLEEWVLHHHKTAVTLYDVAGIAHHVV